MAKKCKKPPRKARKLVPALELMLGDLPAVELMPNLFDEAPEGYTPRTPSALLTDTVGRVISQCEAQLADSFAPNPAPTAPMPPYDALQSLAPLGPLPAEWGDDKCRAALAAADAGNLAKLLMYLRKRRPPQTPAVDAMVDREVLCAFSLGCSYGDCVAFPDRVVAAKAADKIEKLCGPQDATMRDNNERILAVYGTLPSNLKKTAKVARIAEQVGLHPSTVWKHLKGV